MNNFFTKSEFEDEVQRRTGISTFSNFLNESRDFSKASLEDKKIFLSHSHHDSRYVNIARSFFESLGIKVYVDWADKTMPKTTCGETAEKIKQKIRSNEFFVLLATANALNSKWCNWEVGIGDICKLAEDKIVILPLTDDSGQWKENEYLQLYPRIEKPDKLYAIFSERDKVVYPDGHEMPLKRWLNNHS